MLVNSCAFIWYFSYKEVIFDAIKIFWSRFFIGSLTGSGPVITIIIYSSRVFKSGLTYMTCF